MTKGRKKRTTQTGCVNNVTFDALCLYAELHFGVNQSVLCVKVVRFYWYLPPQFSFQLITVNKIDYANLSLLGFASYFASKPTF